MGFFPDLEDKPDIPDDCPTAMYVTSDGWVIDEDVTMREKLADLNLDEKYQLRIDELMATSVPGSYTLLPNGILVILGIRYD